MNNEKYIIASKRSSILGALRRKTFKNTGTGCWFWLGHVGPGYYPQQQVIINKKWYNLQVCRLLQLLKYGYLTDQTRHLCNNVSCVNPAHILNGTIQDNADDRVRAGSARSHPFFTKEQVSEIRKSPLTRRQLADTYNCGISTSRRVERKEGFYDE